MYAIVSSCVCSLESLQRLKESIPANTWTDCSRLCTRADIFTNLLSELKNFPHMLTDFEEEEQLLLTELEKTLISVEAYVADFATRTSFKGITESSFRNGSSLDFAKLSQQIVKFSHDLNIATGEIFEHTRQEDLEVSQIRSISILISLIYSYRIKESVSSLPSREFSKKCLFLASSSSIRVATRSELTSNRILHRLPSSLEPINTWV
jgi:hypothetical protein